MSEPFHYKERHLPVNPLPTACLPLGGPAPIEDYHTHLAIFLAVSTIISL